MAELVSKDSRECLEQLIASLDGVFYSLFSVLVVYKVLLALRLECDCSPIQIESEASSSSMSKYSSSVIVLVNEVPILAPGRLNAFT